MVVAVAAVAVVVIRFTFQVEYTCIFFVTDTEITNDNYDMSSNDNKMK